MQSLKHCSHYHHHHHYPIIIILSSNDHQMDIKMRYIIVCWVFWISGCQMDGEARGGGGGQGQGQNKVPRVPDNNKCNEGGSLENYNMGHCQGAPELANNDQQGHKRVDETLNYRFSFKQHVSSISMREFYFYEALFILKYNQFWLQTLCSLAALYNCLCRFVARVLPKSCRLQASPTLHQGEVHPQATHLTRLGMSAIKPTIFLVWIHAEMNKV